MPVAKIKFKDLNLSLAPLKHLATKSPKAFKEASKRGAIQFLTWANTGTGVSSKKPPIRWGVLRGSSSTFVGNELVKTFDIVIKPGGTERPTPATQHQAAPTTITWVWNTDYAAKMHEWTGGWGKFTLQDGNSGDKWLEEHLRTDKKALLDVIEKEFFRVLKI